MSGTKSLLTLSRMYCPAVLLLNANLVLMPARRNSRGIMNGLKVTIMLLKTLLVPNIM